METSPHRLHLLLLSPDVFPQLRPEGGDGLKVAVDLAPASPVADHVAPSLLLLLASVHQVDYPAQVLGGEALVVDDVRHVLGGPEGEDAGGGGRLVLVLVLGTREIQTGVETLKMMNDEYHNKSSKT